MRPMHFLSACVWFRDVTSFSDASDMACVRVEPVSILTHHTHCSDSLYSNAPHTFPIYTQRLSNRNNIY